MRRVWWFLFCLLLILAACGVPGDSTRVPAAEGGEEAATPTTQELASPTPFSPPPEQEAPFELTSEAFAQGAPIPEVHSCKGDNISPPLAWGTPPAGTQSLALIMDDPDAPGGTWTHWVLFNLPSGSTRLAQGILPGEEREDGSRHGLNSWDAAEYGGPCPPSGTHHYFFRLYALDTGLDLPGGTQRSEVETAMAGHVIGFVELMGTFQK